MPTEKKTNELSLDSISEVCGGRVKLGGYALLTAMMVQYKALGKDKDYCIKALQEGWETDCAFKTKFTDQTGDDLQAAIDFINDKWK